MEDELWDFISNHGIYEGAFWDPLQEPEDEDWNHTIYSYSPSTDYFFDNHTQWSVIGVASIFDAVEEEDNGISVWWEVICENDEFGVGDAEELEEHLVDHCGHCVDSSRGRRKLYRIYKHPDVDKVYYPTGKKGRQFLVATKRGDSFKTFSDTSTGPPKLYSGSLEGGSPTNILQSDGDPDEIIEKAKLFADHEKRYMNENG
ncbi:hypothetical protein [Salinibacter ruber]|uniref:hypothetical protein n=1 Tax=Salinibacter ruber TaxID=146919 RepID=UPI00216A1BAB|nr:hypothetical protein [Salinibacter ruber]MCS3698090.1 hypothetical protein [Salinibacter ruber]